MFPKKSFFSYMNKQTKAKSTVAPLKTENYHQLKR